jgi:superfamily I DNA/RNA helicase
MPTYGVITYTNTLVSSNKALFDNLNGGDPGSSVSHSTLDKIAYSILSKKIGGKLNLINTEGVSNWLVKIAKDSQNSEETLLFDKLGFQYIAEEVEEVVHGNNLTNLQEYKDQDRRGRKIAITQKDRSTIWTIHETLLSMCKQKRVLTFGMFRCLALTSLIKDKHWPRFSALFVDEVQDMGKVSRLLCLNLVKNPRNLLLAADTAQAIYTIPPTWRKTHEIFNFIRRKPLKLEKSYRSTKEISEAIKPLVIDPGDEDDQSNFPKPTRSGPKPQWVDAALQNHVEVSCELIKKITSDREGITNFGQIAIIVREGARANEHVKHLIKNGIKATVISKDHPINIEDDKVHIVTAHSSKGLSFPIVIVPHVANGVYPMAHHMNMAKDPEHREKILEGEQRLLYVALSRSSAWLYMITDPSDCSPYTLKLNRAECWR